MELKDEKPRNEKPTWLQVLEAESWQAELIVSGIAIYGSLQLPELINRGLDYSLQHFGEGYHLPLYFIFWYLLLGSSTLIVSFIAHFVLRALWIGMVGLASVYPEGINTETEVYSASFVRQLKETFPDLGHFNQRLDQLCSLIFAFAFAVVLVFLSITLLMTGALLLTALVRLLIPEVRIGWLFGTFLLLLFLPGLLSGILNQRKLRDKEWVEKIHFPFTVKAYGRIIYNFAYEPISYIIYTFVTNVNVKRIALFFFLYTLCIVLLSFPLTLQSNIFLLFKPDFFQRLDERDDRLYALHYEDQRPPGRTIIRPVIPSEQIDAPFLRLFIPLAQREEGVLDTLCGEYKAPEGASEKESIRARRAFRLECLRRYYTLSINDTPITAYDMHFFDHPNREEEGVLIHYHLESLETGMHTLRIEYGYKNEEGEAKVSLIPFWYTKP